MSYQSSSSSSCLQALFLGSPPGLCEWHLIEPRIGVIFWSTRNTMSEENLGSHDKVGGKVVANGTL